MFINMNKTKINNLNMNKSWLKRCCSEDDTVHVSAHTTQKNVTEPKSVTWVSDVSAVTIRSWDQDSPPALQHWWLNSVHVNYNHIYTYMLVKYDLFTVLKASDSPDEDRLHLNAPQRPQLTEVVCSAPAERWYLFRPEGALVLTHHSQRQTGRPSL